MKYVLIITLLSCSLFLSAEDTIPTLNIAQFEVINFDELTLSSFEGESPQFTMDFINYPDNLTQHQFIIESESKGCGLCVVGGVTAIVGGGVIWGTVGLALWSALGTDLHTGEKDYYMLMAVVIPAAIAITGGILLINYHSSKKAGKDETKKKSSSRLIKSSKDKQLESIQKFEDK